MADGRRVPLLLALFVGALLAQTAGWSAFWFLCDDAYIAFRYVAQSHLGHGYVWNPPPFRPVEGYTSFLWVALLDGIWRVFGLSPPQAANRVSLLCSWASLGLVFAMALRLPLSPKTAPLRLSLVALILLGTVTNRTWLAWTSSGLETAMWTTLLLTWTWLATARGGRPPWAMAAVAALLALTRPDGLLFVAATGAWVGLVAWRSRDARALLAMTPFLAVAAHLAWRLRTYGYPLPNTYYAKHLGAWPDMGLLYLQNFAIEYAFWIWGALVVLALLRVAWSGPWTVGAPLVAAVSLTAHFAYYTLIVGGDHFEFRIYHHLVPLVLLTFPWACDRLGLPGKATVGLLIGMLALGTVIPWTHWAHTRHAVGHKDVGSFRYPVARHLPGPLAWYAQPWDRTHRELLSHFVGIRHQGHKTYARYQVGRFPSLEEGSRIAPDGYPVLRHSSVGVPGWTMPHVAIIDTLGLNDAVIARTPSTRPPEKRKMAHDRSPPPGYVDCFQPNVRISQDGQVTVEPRRRPLTAEAIVDCEERFLARITDR